MEHTISHLRIPSLILLHSGKVRDSYALPDKRRMIFVSDRISAFDKVLTTPVPLKGAALNKLSNFWFEKTSHIIQNHFITEIDPNITIVKEVTPIRIEMVVRAYMAGALWRYYRNGKRNLSGIHFADGLTKHAKFPEPILTPTTKETNDREITPQEIMSSGLADADTYDKMSKAALELFAFASEYLMPRGIILVDTKYEFGLLDGELILMDEIHTPDASRFWRSEDYERDPDAVEQMDKEFVRLWLINNRINGEYPIALPEDIIAETTKRYKAIYCLITGEQWDVSADHVATRIYSNLIKHGIVD